MQAMYLHQRHDGVQTLARRALCTLLINESMRDYNGEE